MNLTKFMKRKKLTQKELAEKLNLSTSFIGQLATNRSNVSYDTMIKLIDLGITPEELLGEESSRKLQKNASPPEALEINDELAIKIISRGLELLLDRRR